MTETLRPDDEAGVVEFIGWARGSGKRVRLFGGGLVAVPGDGDDMNMSLAKVSGLVEHRPQDLVATARAGTPLEDLAVDLYEHGQRFVLAPFDRDGRGTVGGLFASASDGLEASQGWRARDVLLGARAVIGTGEVVTVGSKVVKSVAGFDVARALVGSRGTLGALTEVTFRVEAVPEASVSSSRPCADGEEVKAAVAAADGLALAPRGLAVRKPGASGGIEVHALLEGPLRAVEAAVRRLVDAGFATHRGGDPGFGEMARLIAVPPPTGLARLTGKCSRADPMESEPAGSVAFVADVLRQRFVAHVPDVAATDERPEPSRLFERVRIAFDPDDLFRPGRGYGAS